VPSLADSALPEVPVRPVAAALLPVELLAEESLTALSPAGNTRLSEARFSRGITTGWRSLVMRV